MPDPLHELMDDIYDAARFCEREDSIRDFYQEVQILLNEYGFMIVPIEDPTNLYLGREDDDDTDN